MEENKKEKNSFSRRTLIKGLAGVPILGLFSYEAFLPNPSLLSVILKRSTLIRKKDQGSLRNSAWKT